MSNWTDDISERAQLLGWWCGIGFFVLFFAACWPMAGFIPPPDPTLDGQQLIERYSGNLLWIKAAMPLGLFGSALLVPWSSVLAIQIARMEHGRIPFSAITCVGTGAANAVAFYLPFVFWAGAFYRTGRDPASFLLINDMTWLEFVMVWPPVFIQMLCVAITGLNQASGPRVFPRWYCYLCLWCALALIPGSFIIFFQTGPFTWNGLLGWWTPLTAYVIYILTSFVMVRRAIASHAAERRAAAAIPPSPRAPPA